MNVDRALQDIFVDEGYISLQDLQVILADREDASEPVGNLLLRKGLITASQKLKCLALQTGIPFLDIKHADIDGEVAMRLPHRLAIKHHAILIDASETAGSVAMANALDLDAIDAITQAIGLEIDPMWSLESDLTDKISEIYGGYNDLDDILAQSSLEFDGAGVEFGVGEDEPTEGVVSLAEVVEGSPVIQYVNALFLRAIRLRASDIHIEPRQRTVRIRFRIDGMLKDMMDVPKDIHRAIASRIKVLSGLDIAERRIPQDGRCSMVSPDGEFDFRIATYPTVHGEKLTIRVLDKRGGIRATSALGIEAKSLETLLASVDQSQGLILVTGPTGSGKTTTLYSLLNYVNRGDRQVITVEDPVEYQLDGIVQGNVNKAAGMTFATGLRAILRADPDVILVGESRDPETAKTSIEAALTGHLVLTSLHSNDSAAAVTRLVEMGVEPFLVASSVTCAVAQRLLRVNCLSCSEPYDPQPEILERLRLPSHAQYLKGLGCDKCNGTGYRGRMGVYEVLGINNAIRKLIIENAPSTELRTLAIADGMTSIFADACQKAIAGQTTVEEVTRVVANEEAP